MKRQQRGVAGSRASGGWQLFEKSTKGRVISTFQAPLTWRFLIWTSKWRLEKQRAGSINPILQRLAEWKWLTRNHSAVCGQCNGWNPSLSQKEDERLSGSTFYLKQESPNPTVFLRSRQIHRGVNSSLHKNCIHFWNNCLISQLLKHKDQLHIVSSGFSCLI